MRLYFNYYFFKSISFSIILFFCQTSFGKEDCSFPSLNAESVRQIETKIQERVIQRITSSLDTRDSDIIVPIRVFEDLPNRNVIPSLYPYVSTSFYVHTTKQQEICHSEFSNSMCNFNPRFEIFFDKILIRDEQGVPIMEKCILSSQIILQIVNITKGIYLGAIEIFRYGETIHQWVIPISKKNMEKTFIKMP